MTKNIIGSVEDSSQDLQQSADTKLRIGLVGFFGWGNFGDELFFQQWETLLSSHDVFRVHDMLEKPYFSRSARSIASEADVLVIGGGDLIRTEAISPLYWNGAWVNRPIVVSGIGVAEESGVNRPDVIPRLKKFFDSANVLSLSARDANSQEWIRRNIDPSVPVRVVPDLAFAIDTEDQFSSPRTPSMTIPVVGFTLNKSVDEDDRALLSALRGAHLRGEIQLRILALALGDQLIQELMVLEKFVHRNVIEVFSSVSDMIRAISELDLLYSAKFHGLVVAARFGIPSRSLRKTSKAVQLAAACSLVEMASRAVWGAEDVWRTVEGSSELQDQIEPMICGARRELAHVRENIMLG